MAIKKARQRISYEPGSTPKTAFLENARSSDGGHRLGVNGLAVDNVNDVLYSGGRDGIVCAWDLDGLARTKDNDHLEKRTSITKFRAQTQAHMNWINDIALTKNNTALVSASSDLSVKVWRPHSEEDSTRAVQIGEHADYVKCIAPPPNDIGENWIASGGLDRKIYTWDLNGGGKILEIDVKGDDVIEKGSVYALSVGRNILATGGPENTVKLYDPRTGSQISKLRGHVDNIRSILIDDAGDTVLSASSDKTIKMWSIKGGRCIYTFTMHEDSVWSLYSEDPRLGIFYSSDRSGIVAKTDVRGSLEEIDDGLSLAVVKEHCGVNKIVASKGSIWTATNQSSINRWRDVETRGNDELPGTFPRRKETSTAPNHTRQTQITDSRAEKGAEVPSQSVLRISHTALFPMRASVDHGSNVNDNVSRKNSILETHYESECRPIHDLPEETIEGQFGLLKHRLLNDRKRVLTLDTAGDVLLWDLIKCKAVQSFGKQHLEDVEVQVNTKEAVAPWCSVDLSSGNLTVVLDPFNCFDAEVYMDEMQLDEQMTLREDQRISLGKWILRYLFAGLIDEEIRRDETHRHKLNETVEKRKAGVRSNGPTSIDIPQNRLTSWESSENKTPKARDFRPPVTPGMVIDPATPGNVPPLPTIADDPVGSPLPGLEKNRSNTSRTSAEQQDYFTSGTTATYATPHAAVASLTEAADPKTEEQNKDKDTNKIPTTPFGKKFRIPFGSKKPKRSASQATQDNPSLTQTQDKAEGSESSSNYDKEVDDNFHGVIQRIHQEYDKQRADAPDAYVETLITPSLHNDTPGLKLPPGTKIIIQEETSGGNVNLYQGTVETVGRDTSIIEQKGPMWLGTVLLHNQIPFKEPVKISFILHPIGDLPSIAAVDGNNRLNANRMLRVRKILAYVAERIEVQPEEPKSEDAIRPEDYLELYVNDQRLSPTMSLATLRTHLWKGGSDIVMYYKANGRKVINPVPIPPELVKEEEQSVPQNPAPQSQP